MDTKTTTEKTIPKRKTSKRNQDHIAYLTKLKVWEKAEEGQPKRDKIQTDLIRQIRDFIPVGKLKEFEVEVTAVDKLTAALAKAKNKRAGVYQAAYDWGKGIIKLMALELKLLISVREGIQDAMKAPRQEIIDRKNEVIRIEADYRATLGKSPKNLTEKESIERYEQNQKKKEAYLKAVQAVDVDTAVKVDYRPLQLQLAKINLSIKVLKSRSASLFPLPVVFSKSPVQPNPLEIVDHLDESIKSWAREMEKEYEGE